MVERNYRFNMKRGLFYIVILAFCLTFTPAVAGENTSGGSSAGHMDNSDESTGTPAEENKADRIHIVADRLETKRHPRHQAEFSGNVRAIGDTFDISADHLIVFYTTTDETGPRIADDAPLEETFDKIIAAGNVTIKTGESIAKAEKAVYDNIENVIVLTGEKPRVSGESGHVSGDRITLHTDSGAVFVESDSGRQVEAVIDAKATDNSQKAKPDDG